jgi:DNA repair exonuclease SbcCD ATPase subunit
MINFLQLRLTNFGTWERANINLHKQGFVCVRGENGSGKTTLLGRAPYWCLFGKTAEGFKVSELTVNSKPAWVRVDFAINKVRYYVARFRNHPTYGNKTLFCGEGLPKSDADSLVADVDSHISRILSCTANQFLHTTYFSQRQFNLFHLLPDTQKKEFLECFSYGSLFGECEERVRGQYRELEKEAQTLEGNIQGLQYSLSRIEEEEIVAKNRTKISIDSYKESIILHEAKIQGYVARIKEIEQENATYHESYAEYKDRQRELQLLTRTVESVTTLQQCPTCYYQMNEFERSQVIDELKQQQQFCQERMEFCNEAYDNYRNNEAEIDNLGQCIEENYSHIRERKARISELRKIKEHGSNIRDLKAQLRDRKDELSTIKSKFALYKFWIDGFGFKGLRNIILGQIITQITERLNCYLQQVSPGKVSQFSMEFAKTKLVSDFMGRGYPTLSGGEKQLVDLCTGLAVRDAAESYNKSRFNFLVMDEPTESLDSSTTARAQELLESVAKPSTFLITHRSIDANFDKILTVQKKNGISTLRGEL